MKSPRRGCVTPLELGLLLVLLISGCTTGGGDGGNGGNNPPPGANTVNVQGLVHTGSPAAPVTGAICRFVDRSGMQQAQAIADAAGEFSLQVPPGTRGSILCLPPNLSRLALSTFVSTEGAAAGDTIPAIGREEVSPQTTVVTALLVQEDPADRQSRKAELLAAIAAQDPTILPLVDAAAVLYQELSQAQIDVGFDVSGEEGGDSGADAGGVSGDVGDGAEFSPIPSAECVFVLELQEDVLFSAVLHDLFDDGQLTRPDLRPITEQVNAALAEQATAIAEAFRRRFPAGLGQPLMTIAADANSATPGRYFLPVPLNIPGFVRCHPPNREGLVIATFTPSRAAGEILMGQDVTPATTVFSAQIAAQLPQDRPTAQENFFAGIRELRVSVDQDNEGNIVSFRVLEPNRVVDREVGIVAFTATALYTALLTEGISADFLTAVTTTVEDLAVEGELDPERLIEAAGVPTQQAEQARRTVSMVNNSTMDAAAALQTRPQDALSRARLLIRVRERRTDDALPGVTVDVVAPENVVCTNCPQETDDNGEATLNVANVPTNVPVQVTVRAENDIDATEVSIMIVALARITVDIQLEQPTGSGGGTTN